MSLNKSYNYNIGTMGNINVNNLTAGSINASGLSSLTNVTATNISIGTINASTGITTGALLATGLISSANLSSVTATIPNIVNTNISSGAIQTSSINASGLISSANLSAVTATIPNFINTNISSGAIQTSNINASGLISSANLSAVTATIPNVMNTNISSGTINVSTGITTASINVSGLVSSANLSAVTATLPNIMNTNISSGAINASTGITTSSINITGLFSPTNMTVTNATTGTINVNTDNNIYIAPKSHLYVTVAYGSSIAASSADGITWTQRSLPLSRNWECLTVNPMTGVFVAVAYGSSDAVSSTNGITWTQRSMPVSANWNAMTVNPVTGIFVAVASNSTIAASSTDGISWTQRTLPVSANWYSVTVNPMTGVFVAVAYGSSIAASSTDGITWTQRSLPVTANWTSVTVNPNTGVFVAVSRSTNAASSTDGITWTQRTLPLSQAWLSVNVNPTTGVFVAVSNSSSVAALSSNGTTWSQVNLPVSANWSDVTVSPTTGVFITVAYNSSIAASSSDGITWTQRSLPTSTSWSLLAIKGTNNLVGVGTSTPQYTLDVNGGIRAGFGGMNLLYGANNGLNVPGNTSTKLIELTYANSTDQVNIYTPGNNSSSSKLCLQHNGNVGIGTTIPSYILDVNGTGRFTSALYANTTLNIGNSSVNCPINVSRSGSSDVIPSTGFGGSTVFGFGTNENLADPGYGLLGGVISSSGTSWLQSKYTASSNTLGLAINPLGGNVGVGTSNIALTFHVAASNVGDTIRIENTSASGYACAQFKTTTQTYYVGVGGTGAGNINLRDKLYILNPSTNGIVLDTNGFCGIGTQTPSYPLHVSGSANGSFTYAFVTLSGSNTFMSGAGNFGSNPYSIYATSRIAANEFNAFSDERIKKDIVDVDDISALAILRQIQPKQYKYKDVATRGAQPVWGFIAQQVASVLDYSTKIIKDFLPNIYEVGDVTNTNTITLTTKTTSELVVDKRIRLIRTDDKTVETKITGITDSHSFTVEDSITTDKVFVYGIEVDDFHTLNKDAIFTVATAALQEVDRELQAEKEKTQTLQSELDQLKQFIQSKFPGEF